MNTAVLQGSIMATTHGIHRLNRHKPQKGLIPSTERLGTFLTHHNNAAHEENTEYKNLLPFTSIEYIPHADETPRKAVVVAGPDHDDKFLRINIGGASFTFLTSTLLIKNTGLLSSFAMQSQDQRLLIADAFFSNTREYYFERPPALFHVIYQFYTTGKIHQSPHICPQDLLDEFKFWKLEPANLLDTCACLSDDLSDDDSGSEEDKSIENGVSEFKHLRFGGLREEIWNIIEEPNSSMYAQIFTFLSVLFVLISIGGLVLGSLPDLQVEVPVSQKNRTTPGPDRSVEMEPHPILVQLEYVCIVWFLFEYVTKMLVSADRWKTFCQLLNIIDLFAILPFMADMVLFFVGIDTEQLRDLKGALLVIRILRVLRVIRVLKLGRYSSGLQMFGKTLQASFRQLGMMAMVVMTGVIFFSTLVYFLEKDEPESQFISIPAACWFSIVTMTTVGYGDLTPVTVGGKLVATGAIACGVLVLALPITIIVDNFMKVAESERKPGFAENKRVKRLGPRGRVTLPESPKIDQAQRTPTLKLLATKKEDEQIE
uniref:BTB domain-containing protein n=1 Tax=Bursaphelenchus xylophilus TaxID=6326 RepID=A0A1I7STN9_BURXY